MIESDKTIIEAKDLTRCFKVSNADTMLEYIAQIFTHKKEVKYAVKDMSFTIEKGETVALLGVNGAGKSTLIKMMAGILVPSSGEIKVFGRDPFKKRKENCRKIGAVFGQRTQLRWDLSPLEYYKLIKAGVFTKYKVDTVAGGMFHRIGKSLFDHACNAQPNLSGDIVSQVVVIVHAEAFPCRTNAVIYQFFQVN